MLSPKLPSMFKTPKPKHFDYKPLYYDEAKEEREKRHKRIRAESGGGKYFSSFSIRHFTLTGDHPKGVASRIKSNIRLIIIIFALTALAYYIIIF